MMQNKLFIIIFFVSMIMLYITMLIDTNNLMKQARAVFLGMIPNSETKGKPIDMYSDAAYYGTKVRKVDLTLKRVINLHNFFDGYIIVYYSVSIYDHDDEILSGSTDVFSIWKIHKENGQWLIIDIKEAP